MNLTATPGGHGARDSYLDVIRGLAILGVVSVHFGGSFASPDNAWSSSFHLGLFLNQAFSFAVPLFVFISGLLAGTGKVAASVSDLLGYYRRRFTRIVLPYLGASAAAFYLLGHVAEWQAQPDLFARLLWLAGRLAYSGIEPTFYFIPMIVALYLVQPVLRAMPRQIGSKLGMNEMRASMPLCGLFLGLHLALAWLCYRNILNYYVWGRPCPLFWLFYFFSGLHFSRILPSISHRSLQRITIIAVSVALGTLAWDIVFLYDTSLVGEHFEHSGVDYAYVRPALVVFNLAVCIAIAAGLRLGWGWKSQILQLFGRRSLEIYLWHILVLYEIAWRPPGVLQWCRELPEMILFLVLASSGLIVAVWEGAGYLLARLPKGRVKLFGGMP